MLFVWSMLACSWHQSRFPEAPETGNVYRSNLTIPAGEAFVLGGEQANAFEVRLRHHSGPPIRILGGAEPSSLHQGETASTTVGPKVVARLVNPGDRRARIKVLIVQESLEFLGMDYVPVEP